MATATLTWVAGGGSNSIGQRMQYKLASSSVWTTVTPDLSPTVTSGQITGLANNQIYDFQVGNICNDAATPNYQAPIQRALLTCPTVTFSPQPTQITVSFPHLGGDVSQYKVELLNGTGSAVLQTKTPTIGSTISAVFTGLTANTSYQVRITVFAGATQNYSKVCPAQATATTPALACNAPTSVSATLA